jgi:hypothetical protein
MKNLYISSAVDRKSPSLVVNTSAVLITNDCLIFEEGLNEKDVEAGS